ncbi:hypothetical protein D046_3498 [Vibrio parahaemolyticus V-223/04]|nr:hypothetical protein D046_3498 [Vibrio parahaemolyticus V-223/04]
MPCRTAEGALFDQMVKNDVIVGVSHASSSNPLEADIVNRYQPRR